MHRMKIMELTLSRGGFLEVGVVVDGLWTELFASVAILKPASRQHLSYANWQLYNLFIYAKITIVVCT